MPTTTTSCATTASPLQLRVEQGDEGLPVALGGGRVVGGRVAKDPAVLGGIGFDGVVDAGLRERVLEASLHVVEERGIVDRTRNVDARLHFGRQEMRARRQIRGEAGTVV